MCSTYSPFFFIKTDLGDWEIPNVRALKLSIRDPPTCMIDLVAKEGARVMHVFFRDNLIPMKKCVELNQKEYAPTVCKAPKDERSGKSIGSEKSLEVDDDEIFRIFPIICCYYHICT